MSATKELDTSKLEGPKPPKPTVPELDIDKIDDMKYRHLFEFVPRDDPDGHKEQMKVLKADIKENGIEEPLHVAKIGNTRGTKYVLLSGHDRLTCAKQLGKTAVPVLKRSALTDEQQYSYVVRANSLRKQFTKRQLVSAVLVDHPEWADRRIAAMVGCSAPTVGEARAALQEAGSIQKVAGSKRVNRNGNSRGTRDGTKKPRSGTFSPTPKPKVVSGEPRMVKRLGEYRVAGDKIHGRGNVIAKKMSIISAELQWARKEWDDLTEDDRTKIIQAVAAHRRVLDEVSTHWTPETEPAAPVEVFPRLLT